MPIKWAGGFGNTRSGLASLLACCGSGVETTDGYEACRTAVNHPHLGFKAIALNPLQDLNALRNTDVVFIAVDGGFSELNKVRIDRDTRGYTEMGIRLARFGPYFAVPDSRQDGTWEALLAQCHGAGNRTRFKIHMYIRRGSFSSGQIVQALNHELGVHAVQFAAVVRTFHAGTDLPVAMNTLEDPAEQHARLGRVLNTIDNTDELPEYRAIRNTLLARTHPEAPDGNEGARWWADYIGWEGNEQYTFRPAEAP